MHETKFNVAGETASDCGMGWVEKRFADKALAYAKTLPELPEGVEYGLGTEYKYNEDNDVWEHVISFTPQPKRGTKENPYPPICESKIKKGESIYKPITPPPPPPKGQE